ncbi:unnamed protein product, partial [Linum tenue]
QDGGRPLPKFGEWDVNDPASAEGFTVIFNKARDEKKTGGKPESPGKGDSHTKAPMEHGKPPAVSCLIPTPSPGPMLIPYSLMLALHTTSTRVLSRMSKIYIVEGGVSS